MKKIIYLLLAPFFLTACSKWPMNGQLDGRWQLLSVDWYEGSEVGAELIYPEFTYYDFQLELMHFVRTGGDEYRNTSMWGRFNYRKDSLHIIVINQKKDKVFIFGLSDTIEHFGIEEITRKKMILRSEDAELVFRKF